MAVGGDVLSLRIPAALPGKGKDRPRLSLWFCGLAASKAGLPRLDLREAMLGLPTDTAGLPRDMLPMESRREEVKVAAGAATCPLLSLRTCKMTGVGGPK